VCGDLRGRQQQYLQHSTAQRDPPECVRFTTALLPFCCCCGCCQALIAAHEVMEVRRTLYFAENLGNRNIGGGMRVRVLSARFGRPPAYEPS
jgi:hypothetical protein